MRNYVNIYSPSCLFGVEFETLDLFELILAMKVNGNHELSIKIFLTKQLGFGLVVLYGFPSIGMHLIKYFSGVLEILGHHPLSQDNRRHLSVI